MKLLPVSFLPVFFMSTMPTLSETDALSPVSKKLTVVPNFARKLIPPHPNDLIRVDTDRGRFSVLVYSKRKGTKVDSPLESDIFVFDKHMRLPKLVWKGETKEELYEPAIFAPTEWNMHGHPVIAVTRQAGAAATVADIITFTGKGGVKAVSRMVADRIDIARLNPTDPPLLIVYERAEGSAMYVPKLMRWTGADFQDSSNSYPEFYSQFLEDLSYKSVLDPENSILDRECIARLLRLAGRKDEAKAVLVDLLKEASASPTVEKTVVGRLQTQVTQLGNDK